MEGSRQALECFVEDGVSVVLGNPRLDDGRVEAARQAVAGTDWERGYVLLGTSGTTAEPKWIGLSRSALEISAKAVVAHVGATTDDRWLLSIPAFHVGGAGILFRAWASGAAIIDSDDAGWSPAAFQRQCAEDGITVASLVPTQVHDLVVAEMAAPDCLRVAFIGGAGLDEDLLKGALDLGWPLYPTYGMTEAASQIATATSPDDPRLCVLGHWQAQTTHEGELEIAGPALCSFVLRGEAIEPVEPGAWLPTGDVVDLDDGILVPRGRLDSMVKVLGERVLLDQLRSVLGTAGTIVALPDDRRGHALVAVFEGRVDARAVADYDQRVAPFERIVESVAIDRIPCTVLGKTDERALAARVGEVLARS